LTLSCCKMNCEWDNVKTRAQAAKIVFFLKTEPRKPSFRFLNFEVGSVLVLENQYLTFSSGSAHPYNWPPNHCSLLYQTQQPNYHPSLHSKCRWTVTDGVQTLIFKAGHRQSATSRDNGQLILRKISKTGANRCQTLRPKCTKFDFCWGSDPAGGAYSAPSYP